MLDAVGAIYTDRRFAVRDAGQTSAMRGQSAGICQGCPLSPFLLAMLMSVLLTDARRTMGQDGSNVRDLVYADDTLVVAADQGQASEYMRAIADAGAN